MAVPKPPIIWKGTNNYDAGPYSKDRIVDHWAVGGMETMDAMAAYRNERASTPTFMVDGDHPDKIHQYCQVTDLAWHASSQNGRSVGIEHAGGWMLASGVRMKPTPETHELSAWLHAWIAEQLGWSTLTGRIFGHNRFTPTECPGTLDLAWIEARGNAFLNGSATPGGAGDFLDALSDAEQRRVAQLWGA